MFGRESQSAEILDLNEEQLLEEQFASANWDADDEEEDDLIEHLTKYINEYRLKNQSVSK